MANIINSSGLTTMTAAELIAQFTADFQAIYGTDINLDSDSPDGQIMNIFIQSVLDLEDLLTQVYNGMDPDKAVGTVLDSRVAYNGIQRQAGTYTITPITIVTNQSTNLYGLDQDVEDVYTVSDNAGNQFYLQVTQLGLGSGTHVLNFRAKDPGAVLTIPNTITVPVTVIVGVESVNNPTAATTTGINEESDADLRIRRQKSVSLASQGYLAGLLAALENISGVTSAFVYENKTASTDSDGVPSHSIWVIVAGTATDADIADAIYTKRNAGCGMYGDTSYTVTQVDGSSFIVQWDTVVVQNVFIKFTATSIDGVNDPNIGAILTSVPALYVPAVFEEVDINHLATNVQTVDANCLVTSAGFSTGTTQILTLSGVAASGTFKVAYNGVSSAAINWNDAIGTIQTKVQAVTGLSDALVTGSIASQSLVFDLSALDSVDALIVTNTNSLATGGAVAITFSYDPGYTNVLTPSTKKNQFVIESGNITILSMLLTPSTTSVAALATKQFAGYGGYGTKTYSISVNASGGSINSSSGLYTAGATPGVDTVKVTDLMGNYATATVTVT